MDTKPNPVEILMPTGYEPFDGATLIENDRDLATVEVYDPRPVLGARFENMRLRIEGRESANVMCLQSNVTDKGTFALLAVVLR